VSRHSGNASNGKAPYWVLRVIESALLVAAFAGMAMFAWSLVDIIRIETAPGAGALTTAARGLPAWAWPGIFTFFGSMIALQIVRTVLHRYRRDDGAPRGGERAVAATTADALLEATVPFRQVAADTDDIKGA
jgi:TRAP-type C4-dicarboxylate transport system permease small subunit